MSRTARLLEILITLQAKSRFTVAEMAAEFEVSRRTMLRDLQALSEMGVPLAATPGPGGGYSVIRGRRMLPLTLSSDEAIGVVLSYEAFLQYAQSPFMAESFSAITKLRNAMPPEVVRELDRVHERVAVVQQAPSYDAPLLAELLRAALDGVHLEIVYESLSRVATRLIYPYGLFAAQGFWYCACYDYERASSVALRADRIQTLERKEEREPVKSMTVRDYLGASRRDSPDMVCLRAMVTPHGAKRFELSALFGEEVVGVDGILEMDVPRSDLDWFANQLLALGTDVLIEAPDELRQMMVEKALTIAEAYGKSSSHPTR
ncbi:MAG TPA: YafY family protein [Chloroflexota bacterium]